MKKYLLLLLLPIFNAYAGDRCAFSDALEHYHDKKSNPIMVGIFEREIMQGVVVTPTGHFAIHYDVTGFNAVSNTDNNQNNIPDYIDSVAYYMDKCYVDEVETLGFPFSDYDRNAGGTPMYDIYVKELIDSPYYGGTYPEGSVLDPDGNTIRTSFIVIDNNYSKEDRKYRTTGIDGMKITIYHEFFHSIQFQMSSVDYRVMGEMCATFMEFRFFPEILDYVQWAEDWLESPTTFSLTNAKDANSGYSLSIFLQYTYKQFGDGVILSTWQGISNFQSDMIALDNTLQNSSSSLAESFCDFTRWMYRTGKNSSGKDYFEDAIELPELTLMDNLFFNNQDVTLEAELLPFTFSPFRLIIPNSGGSRSDSIIVLLNNVDFENGKQDKNVKSKAKFIISNLNDGTLFENSGLYYKDLSDQTYCNTTMEFMGQRFAEAYPSPFIQNLNANLYIPAPDNSSVFDYAELEIYTPDMEVLIATNMKVTNNNGHHVLDLSDSDLKKLNTGVYLFKTTFNGDSKIGKFMVKK